MSPFASPPNVQAINEHVWNVVRKIPSGRVMAYGQVGGQLDPPGDMDLKSYDAFKARWVGAAMAQCPDDVPWWRVINAQGKISERPGAQEQRARLEAEGVVFDARDKIDLKRFGFTPDLPEQPSLFGS